MMRRTFSVFFATTISILSIDSSPASGPPPVSRPQACAATYCVEVISQEPYNPYQVEVVTDMEGRTSRLMLKLRGGGVVAFQSRLIERPHIGGVPYVPNWKYEGRLAIASACLTCAEPGRKLDVVLGTAVSGVSFVQSRNLTESMEVCYWPLNFASAGYRTNSGLLLGDRVCIGDTGS